MPHEAVVDKEILLGTFARILGFTHKTPDRHNVSIRPHLHQSRCELIALTLAEHLLNTLFVRAHRQVQQHLVIADQSECHLRVHQYYAVKLDKDIPQFSAVGFQILAPGRGVEEQVLHTYVRAHRCLTNLLANDLRAVDLKERTHLIFGAARRHIHLGHGTDSSQRLTTETHRRQGKQIRCITDLRRGMTLKCHTHIGLGHALTIIYHLHERTTRFTDQNLNGRGAGVKRVLHQLFDTRSGALNHLACSNLVGYTVGKKMNNIHWAYISPSK